jgi:hypothetical protein
MRDESQTFLSGPSACPRSSHGVLGIPRPFSKQFQSIFKAVSKRFQSVFKAVSHPILLKHMPFSRGKRETSCPRKTLSAMAPWCGHDQSGLGRKTQRAGGPPSPRPSQGTDTKCWSWRGGVRSQESEVGPKAQAPRPKTDEHANCKGGIAW